MDFWQENYFFRRVGPVEEKSSYSAPGSYFGNVWNWTLEYGSGVLITLALGNYCLGLYCRSDKQNGKDAFKHLRRVAYLLHLTKLFLAAFNLMRALVMMQVAFVKQMMTGSSDASQEPQYVVQDEILALWDDMGDLFKFDSMHALSLHVLFILVLLLLNVALAVRAGSFLSRGFNRLTSDVTWLPQNIRFMFGRKGDQPKANDGGMVTRSKSRLLERELASTSDSTLFGHST